MATNIGPSPPPIVIIPNFCYIYVLNQTTNIARVEIGPKVYNRQNNEGILFGPEKMIKIPSRHYCKIGNPVIRGADNAILFDTLGQATLRLAEQEFRFEQPPFPLYPGEEVITNVTELEVVCANTALRIRALRDLVDEGVVKRHAGDEWLFEGPVVALIRATTITPNKAIWLKANVDTVDRDGKKRVASEEWLVKREGKYLPSVFEEVLCSVNITTLTNLEYCVILNPVGADGRPQFGRKKLIRGEESFFMQPGEKLEAGIQAVCVLSENEGLVLRSKEAFEDQSLKIKREPGDRWLIRGPCEYVPPVEVEVVAQRVAVPLHKHEGIYVRDNKSGKVRAVCGETYMLTENEELWTKNLDYPVEQLIRVKISLSDDREFSMEREKTKVATFPVHPNHAVKIYDLEDNKTRIVFGPKMVMLGPYEQFKLLSLFGDGPRLDLKLGPDFRTHTFSVVTSDNVWLELEMVYHWHFACDDKSAEEAEKLFAVCDYIGYAFHFFASKIQGVVPKVPYVDFHKNGAQLIRVAIFGLDENQELRKSFIFPENNLVVTSIGIQSVKFVEHTQPRAEALKIERESEIKFIAEKNDLEVKKVKEISDSDIEKMREN